MSPWWSPYRDVQLRGFWKGVDHLSGALYSMTSKMSAIPIRVIPKDKSNKEHVLQAQVLTDVIVGSAQFGKGWVTFNSKMVEELLTQDNGFFAEIIGFGPKDGPIIGTPVSVSHLDSANCTRTGHPIYPVIYQDVSGGRYKLHTSRVMFSSQMESPDAYMFGVGFCAVSRCTNVAQNLLDIITYKMEKLGSRPHRQIVITKGGLDPRDIQEAFSMAEGQMDSMGLSRYSKVVVAGSQALPDSEIQVVELSGLPDGFDEQTSITLGMAAIALALGTDARELFPAITAGATRADALLQHLKQRGKGPGQILQTIENLFNYKFVPRHLKFTSDFQDDAQDRQAAEIGLVRSNRRIQDTSADVSDQRTMREQMEAEGEIDRSQFERMELEDGRMEDGSPVEMLFFKEDERYQKYLDMGVENPLSPSNDPLYMQEAISEKRAAVYETMANSKSQVDLAVAEQCLAALNKLETQYLTPFPGTTPAGETENPEGNKITNPGYNIRSQRQQRGIQGNAYIDPRNRRIDLTALSPDDVNPDTGGE
jgi:hypothetical protein